uniref:Uncharacterized protein n=1 Tax=Arion vulgaris TaxID=1028688 RepID=A0A0B7B304_9EUPU
MKRLKKKSTLEARSANQEEQMALIPGLGKPDKPLLSYTQGGSPLPSPREQRSRYSVKSVSLYGSEMW